MRNSKTKIKNVLDLVDRINILRSEIKEREEELKELTSVQFQEISPEPQGFDYKDSILAFFAENPSSNFNTDQIFEHISSKYKFSPSRETISLRTTYLVDNAKKLERVENKRGIYRLRKRPAIQETRESS